MATRHWCTGLKGALAGIAPWRATEPGYRVLSGVYALVARPFLQVAGLLVWRAQVNAQVNP